MASASLAQGEIGEAPLSWRLAEPGWRYEFPRDHGPHREFKTEWWYATGNLSDVEGHDYGFQLTFFRQGIQPGVKPPRSSRFRVMEIPFAHFAFSDVDGQTFRYYQCTARGSFGEAGFAVPPGRIAWINDWVLEQSDDGKLHLRALGKGKGEERGIDLTLTQVRPPLIHGAGGISLKSSHPGHASHYYSLTRLQAAGTVSINGKEGKVHGTVWFDHEWASNQLASDEAGWDWSGLHLSSGDDVMIFQIRNTAGNTVFSSGTLREATGTTHDIHDLYLTPKSRWKSPHTGGVYPSSWEVQIPSQNLHLYLTTKLADQELVLAPFAYYEGAVKGEGSLRDQPVKAEGYFEMTGYGSKILGLSAQ